MNNTTTMRLGYLPDPLDDRDKLYSAAVFEEDQPAEYLDLLELSDVRISQTGNSCVGYSIANALYFSWLNRNVDKPALASPLFIWYNSRRQHNDELNNSGTYIRTAIKTLSQVGFCENSAWDGLYRYDLLNASIQPPHEAYQRAIDQKLDQIEYRRVYNSAEIKDSLLSGNPVIVGMSVYDKFMFNSGDLIELPDDVNSAVSYGGHAVCCLGYTESGILFVNSWGRDWGEDGIGHVSWDYLDREASDMWSLNSPQYFSEK